MYIYPYLGVVLPASTSLLSDNEAIKARQWSYLHENKISFPNFYEETTTTTTTPKPTVELYIKPARLIGSLRKIFNTLPIFKKKTIEKRNHYIPRKFKIYEAVPTTN